MIDVIYFLNAEMMHIFESGSVFSCLVITRPCGARYISVPTNNKVQSHHTTHHQLFDQSLSLPHHLSALIDGL